MADSIGIPAGQYKAPPSHAIRAGWFGAWLGDIIGGIGGNAVGAALGFPGAGGMLGLGVGAITGYLAGAHVGAQQDELELKTGKKAIEKPSFLNWKLAKGVVVGNVIYTGICIAVAGLRASGAAGEVMGVAAAIAMAASVLVPLAGLIYGGISGKREMQMEYDHAKEMKLKKSFRIAVERSRAVQRQSLSEASSPLHPWSRRKKAL